jgi:AcrR family transcriptional regulator
MLPTPSKGAQAKPTRPELPREFVAVRKRRRIMDAIAELTAEQGYEATKIADIVGRARVARKTLYDNFDGKEDVFLAAFDAALADARAQVEEACNGVDGEWSERTRAGLGAFLGWVAENPATANMAMVQALSATPASSARYEEGVHQFIELLRRGAPDDTDLPATTEETLIGGVAWILNQQIRRGKAAAARDLLSELSEFLLSPYFGVGKPAS